MGTGTRRRHWACKGHSWPRRGETPETCLTMVTDVDDEGEEEVWKPNKSKEDRKVYVDSLREEPQPPQEFGGTGPTRSQEEGRGSRRT